MAPTKPSMEWLPIGDYDLVTKPAGKPDGGNMGRKYDVIDADGHVLEPFTLWDDYMDPKYRERAPKLVKDENGKERLLLEDKIELLADPGRFPEAFLFIGGALIVVGVIMWWAEGIGRKSRGVWKCS